MTRIHLKTRRAVLSAVGIFLLLATAAVVAATIYAGRETERIQQAQLQAIVTQLHATGWVRLTGNRYQRGLFSSDQRIELTLGKEGEALNVPVTLTSHIQHGPFPGFRSIGAAAVDTDVQFTDPELQQKFEAALGGQKPSIHTLVGWNGDMRGRVSVPAGQYAEGGNAVSWQALVADVKTTGTKTTARIDWPGLKIKMPQGELTLAGLSAEQNMRKQNPLDPLGVGDQSLTLKRLTFNTPTGEDAVAIVFDDMKVSGKSAETAGFYNVSLLYGIGSLNVGRQGSPAHDYQNVQLHLSMDHLAREPLARITQLMRDADQRALATPGQTSGLTEFERKALMDDALAVLQAQPVLSIDRLSVTQPSGEILLTGKVELPGAAQLNSQTAQMIAGFPLAGLSMAKVQARFKAPEVAVVELLKSLSPDAARNLNSFIQAGMLKREGDALVSDLLVENGKTTVNGQAVPGGG